MTTTPASEPGKIPDQQVGPLSTAGTGATRGTRLAPIFIAVTAVAALGIGGFAMYQEMNPELASADPPPGGMSSDNLPDFTVKRPAIYAATRVRLDDNEEVVGVIVDGKARAYCVRAMKGTPMVHIVNDVVGSVPISVTYCDRNRCMQVLTDSSRDAPLAIGFGGRFRGHLMIKAGGARYDQATLMPVMPGMPRFPYGTVPFLITTWGEWKKAHPDTDLYLGSSPPASLLKP
ncbi:MAG TPA: DUF3179 domain-containing (seleno)protein [Gemmataceae bacterium]|nr:DUF3179 domain-containing (seleno)protein [Gemmataceae bacterium]